MVGDLQRAVGANLRRIREEMGLSQERFAEVVGVHRTYMGGLERGERNLTLRSLEGLAETLKVDPVSLMAPTPKATRPRRQGASPPMRSRRARR